MKAMRVSELYGTPFVLQGLLWEMVGHRESTERRGDKLVPVWELDVTPVHRKGLKEVRPGVHTAIIERGHRDYLPHRAGEEWMKVRRDEHVAICADCMCVWPCRDHALNMAARYSEYRNRRLYCERCDVALNGKMSIVFGDEDQYRNQIREAEAVGQDFVPRLRLVEEDHNPTTAVEPTKPVAFCGRLGACRNAAYRYAAEHNWDLPPRDQTGANRPWRIKAVQTSPATAHEATEPSAATGDGGVAAASFQRTRQDHALVDKRNS